MLLKIHRRTLRSASALRAGLVGLAVVGCTPLVDYRGNLPDPQALESIQPGIATKADVTTALGSPSSVATFDPNTWYYISKHTETVAFFEPETVDQKVVQISFDADGKVVSLKRYGPDDAADVPIAKDVTPTAGQSITILQQFFGNLGRFSETGGSKQGY